MYKSCSASYYTRKASLAGFRFNNVVRDPIPDELCMSETVCHPSGVLRNIVHRVFLDLFSSLSKGFYLISTLSYNQHCLFLLSCLSIFGLFFS